MNVKAKLSDLGPQSGLTGLQLKLHVCSCVLRTFICGNDKYYHFYAICFGMGYGSALYRPFRSLMIPSVLAVSFAIIFEIVGIISDLPAHTRRCKGPPFEKRDVCWGFCFALFMAILNLNSYCVYTLSYGWGIIVFALRGAIRKYNFLRKLKERG